MTAMPYRSKQPFGRDGFGQLVRAELTKFRSVRAWMITLGVAAFLIVVFAWVGVPHTGVCVSQPGSPPSCGAPSVPRVPVGPGGQPVVDTFSFVRQPLAGNGTLTARVNSLVGATSADLGPSVPSLTPSRAGLAAWAKAGLIITQSTAQGSRYAAVMVTPGHGVRFQNDYTNDVAGLSGTATPSSPRWLRLTRLGAVITGYDSLDGIHWTKLGAAQLEGLPRALQIGLFVTSPDEYSSNGGASATLATATFDRIRLAGDLSSRSWSHEIVGASSESDFTAATQAGWFKQSDGVFTISGSGDIAPQVSGGLLEGLGQTISLLAGGTFGLIAVIVLATLFITSEYRRNLIRTTFTASPRRVRALAAKGVVIAGVTFVTASIATALSAAISRHVLAADGNYVFPVGTATQLRVILGTGLLFALAAVGILSLGTVLRRSAGAVVIGIVVFVLPFILLGPFSSDWLLRIAPVAGFAIQGTLPRFAQVGGAYTMSNGYYPFGPWVGLAVLCAWSAVAFAAAAWALRRRDI